MNNLPYNLKKNYASSNWEIDCIKQRILHKNTIVWNKLKKYGLEYKYDLSGVYFPNNIEIIGIGAFSLIYEIKNTNYVLKITNNIREIKWSNEIINLQKTNTIFEENYIKIFDIIDSDIYSYYIDSGDDSKDKVSFIITEKLNVINNGIKTKLISFENKMYEDINCLFVDEFIKYESIKNYIEDLEYSDKPLNKNFKILLNKLIQLGIDREKYGWFDFHFDNLMIDNNQNYKILNLQS